MLQDQLDGVDIVDVSEILDDEKSVFSDEELDHVRAVADILDHGMTSYLDNARLGTAEITLAGRAMVAMMEHAATRHPSAEVRVNCYSQQGLRTLEPHTASTGAPLEAGQLMCVVMEAYVWNYQGALERVIALGDIPDDAERLRTAIVEAQQRAFAAIGPGMPMSEVDRVSRAVFEQAGFAVAPSGAGLGRGLLTEWEGRLDRMNLRAYNDRPMVPNMVFTVEPFTFAEGIGAPRHCDLVRVTDDGRENLNKARSGYLEIR
jgi:Xaa-Pro aminopeptidase